MVTRAMMDFYMLLCIFYALKIRNFQKKKFEKILIYIENIVFSVPRASVVILKALLISSSNAPSIQTKGKHINQTASEPTKLKASCLEVKMLQSMAIYHSFYKLKILLLILDDFPNSAHHNFTCVMVPSCWSSVTSHINLYIHVLFYYCCNH